MCAIALGVLLKDAVYRESMLPPSVLKHAVVEASSPSFWQVYTGFDGACITIVIFGALVSGLDYLGNFGFTIDNVVSMVRS